jgi:hypothetical protein
LRSTGRYNTADGARALESNTTGDLNTAIGGQALFGNIAGSDNTANGYQALFSNTTGTGNIAFGRGALFDNTSGSYNIAVGAGAGRNLTTGNRNIDIGSKGVAGEANTIRIGSLHARAFIAGISGVAVTGSTIVVNASGQLGVAASSKRFKEAIKPMDKTSEALFSLNPVAFRYNKEIDPERKRQFGLVAEEVEKVDADLVVRDKEGRPFTVRYDQINAMLLNEFLKEHRTVEELKREIAGLAATVREQAAQIQKVSTEIELSEGAPQTVLNNQ